MRGNMGNMNEMLRKAQKMQQDFAKLQEELKNRTVEAASGGGVVTVVASGAKQIISIKIEKELASSGDEQMLQDLVLAAVNAALDKAAAMVEEETKKITGGMSLPGGF